ncbi:ganglioside-induced differentiation-associated protein 2 [Ixodes scapularis]|uniref:ganglioside-induced differentiation-associated protein 2 n=1 Tax=Ixodes scapularis TaxID=6945 RepID=UPI001C37FAC2|nr:ganglioside-induced differentiation-associated protein 2 [Ixodes scapularis]
MEPLGSVPDVVDVAVLKRWHQIAPQELGLAGAEAGAQCPADVHERTPFPVSEVVNRKVALWVGDLTSLNTHAIVNSTNENLTDKSPLSQRIVERAGEQLRRDMLNEIRTCRTGEAKLSKGYNLPARFVIHTVGPKYNAKFRTAAESALHSSYWRVLQMLPEHGLATLGLCPIHSARRGYPLQDGAHLALRTLRRFLELHGDCVELVVLVMEGTELGMYEQLLPLYFPRTQWEEHMAQRALPEDVGGPNGEPLLPERIIRIVDKPFGGGVVGEEAEHGSHMEGSVVVGRTAFARMQGDVDRHGARPPADALTMELQRAHRYERLLRRARMEDLRAVREARFLYEGGRDRKGRPVFVFVGRRFRALDPEKVLLQLLLALDSVAPVQPFSVVYLHTLAEEPPQLGEVLRDAFELLEPKHRQNLHTLYLVHPGFWTRVAAWWFTAFKVPDMRGKVNMVSRLDELFLDVAPEQLDLPRFVLEHDLLLHGSRPQGLAQGAQQ